MDLGLHQVHVLVTGAAGGIGFETVQRFLKHGAYVTAQYHTSPGPLKELQTTVNNLELVQADATDESSVERLFHHGGKFFEQEVQVLVVNHGIFPTEDVHLVDMGLEQWKHTLDVNLTGPFLLAREFLRRLRKPRETFAPDLSKVSVVVVGSTSGEFGEAGHVGTPHSPDTQSCISLMRKRSSPKHAQTNLRARHREDYSCSKAALQSGFIRTVKNEIVNIAPAGRINAVSPGWVRTAMAEATLADPSVYQRAIATTPLKKVATSADVARQILVLASTIVSGHITGQNLVVSGGMEGRLLDIPTVEDRFAEGTGIVI